MREEGELKEIEKSGCDMDGPMGMARFDLNSIDIEWSGESTGQLVPCFRMEPLLKNEYWVITSLVSSEEVSEEDPSRCSARKAHTPEHRAECDFSTRRTLDVVRGE